MTGPLDEGRAVASGEEVYPSELRDRDWWVNWVRAYPFDDDGEVDTEATPTKQPVAPYDTGHGRPVRWHSGLDEDEHPATAFIDVVEWDGTDLGLDIPTHDRVVSDEIGIGIIIPVGGGDGRQITLLDWDDVRDPETGDVHPVCAAALRRCDGYAEISQSGEGIHQFVFGEIPGGLSKFLRHIDDEPFVGDSLPMLEMYNSGRVCAMTGDHVEGTGDDVVDGQDMVDDLCREFGLADNNSPGVPTDPFGRRDDPDRDVPSHEETAEAMREAVAYDGDDPAQWDIPDGEPLAYHAVLRARERSDEMPNTSNWELMGLAAGLAYEHDIPKEQVLEDFEAHPTPQYGYDEGRAQKEIRGVWRKAEAGNYQSPNLSTLSERGIIPDLAADGGREETAGGGDDDGKQDADAPSWNYVQALYGAEEDGTEKKARKAATEALLAEQPIMTVTESDAVWRYDHAAGYYQRYGEEYVHGILVDRLDVHYSISERREIVDRMRAETRVRRDRINAADESDPLLCVANGVVNLRTGELLDHDPDYNFIRGLEWEYDPDADSSRIVEFLESITERDADWKTLVDHLAHGLMPGHPYRAFVMTYGPGGNGKTQLGELLRGFVGEANAAAVELQDLAGGDDFATGALPGAFVNIGDDVSVGEIRDTSILKTLTGGGTSRSNEKYEKKFEFKNEAAMFFSANEPPRFAEAKQSIDDRLYPIRMPFRFVDDPDPDDPYERQKVPGMADELLDDNAAMRGLLALVVEHAQRLIKTNGEYSMPEGPSERRARYEAASDPILRFVVECVEEAEIDDLILKDDAYSVYTALCDRDDDRPASEDVFKRKVSQQTTVDVQNSQTRQLTPGDSRQRAWKFVRFDESAKSLMPPRLVERYFPGHEQADMDGAQSDDAQGSGADDTGADGETDEFADTERAAFGAEPIMRAADSLTGYVTVTAEIVTTVGLGETDSGCKAVLKDASGAIDLVSWDAGMNSKLREHEGRAVAVRNAEVSEYDGDHQLSPVEGLTTVEQIQRGVGFTEAADPDDVVASETDDGTSQGGIDDTQDTAGGEASTDGGSEYEGPKGQVHEYLRKTGSSASVPELAGALSLDPGTAKEAAEALAEDGRVVDRSGQFALND